VNDGSTLAPDVSLSGGREGLRARAAISVVFFANGAVFASWLAHIPAVKNAHHISDGALGLVMLSTAIGSVLALPIGGGWSPGGAAGS
jgi:hypothetical protein